jgi:hypothetical protein
VAIEGDKGDMMMFPVDYNRNASILEKRLGELSPIPSWHVLRSDEMTTNKYPFPPTVYEIKCELEVNGKPIGFSKHIAIESLDLLGTEETVQRLQFQFANTLGAKVLSLHDRTDGHKV